MKNMLVRTFVLFALAIVGCMNASAQVRPISERVLQEYVISVRVPDRQTEVRIITTKREHDGNKVFALRQEVESIVRNVCVQTCTDHHKRTIKKKVMETAKDQGFRPVNVLFK